MPTGKPSMVDQVLALHRQHYGDEFAVIVQDEHLVPRLLALLIERRQKQSAARLTIAPMSSSTWRAGSAATRPRARIQSISRFFSR